LKLLLGYYFGLERIGGLREPEDLRGSFIIPALSWLTSYKRKGPLIKGSRDSVTAVNCFAALNFWFVLFQDKMNKKPFKIEKYIFDLLT